MLHGIESNQVPLNTGSPADESGDGIKFRSGKAAPAEACCAPSNWLGFQA